MKKIFLTLVLILSLQSWTKADDIKDFEIEGISLGDSLLDHFSKNEIKKQLKRTTSNYASNKIVRNWFVINSKTYDQITVHYKNDGSYKIVNIGGTILYNKNNMNECFPKMNEVINDIEKQLPLAKKINKGKKPYSKDPTGKSYRKFTIFKLNKGEIYIGCVDWSKHIEDKNNWNDHFSVELDSPEFINWLNNEAFK